MNQCPYHTTYKEEQKNDLKVLQESFDKEFDRLFQSARNRAEVCLEFKQQHQKCIAMDIENRPYDYYQDMFDVMSDNESFHTQTFAIRYQIRSGIMRAGLNSERLVEPCFDECEDLNQLEDAIRNWLIELMEIGYKDIIGGNPPEINIEGHALKVDPVKFETLHKNYLPHIKDPFNLIHEDEIISLLIREGTAIPGLLTRYFILSLAEINLTIDKKREALLNSFTDPESVIKLMTIGNNKANKVVEFFAGGDYRTLLSSLAYPFNENKHTHVVNKSFALEEFQDLIKKATNSRKSKYKDTNSVLQRKTGEICPASFIFEGDIRIIGAMTRRVIDAIPDRFFEQVLLPAKEA